MAPVSVTQQARVLTGLAIAGAVPMTLGAILWLIGTAMGAAYHGHWGGTAGLGEVLLLAGLLCGLAIFVFAAAAERWTPREPEVSAGQAGQDLTPLATPEQQAFLTDPAFPAPAAPPPPLPGPTAITAPPPALSPFTADPYLAEPQFPPDDQWPDQGPEPPPYPAFPGLQPGRLT